MLAIGLQLPGERLINVSPHAVTPPFTGPARPDLAWLSALGPTPMGMVLGLISGCAGDSGRITGYQVVPLATAACSRAPWQWCVAWERAEPAW